MPVQCDLHGRMIVQLPVPVDAQQALGTKKLSRMVRVRDGETVASVTAELQAQIDKARVAAPMRITVDIRAHHDQASKDRIEKAIRTLMGTLDLDEPFVNIRFEKPRS